MKYVKQFLIILLISLVGEILKQIIPLPVPASIYGMVLLFIGLLSGIIKLESVKECGTFLIEIMPVMFIPAGVGLIESWSTLQTMLFPACLVTVVTLVTVMAATGRVSQWIIRREKDGEADE